MTFWNKLNRLCVLVTLLVVFSSVVDAQTVRYYKLTKTKISGVVSSNVSGGQYICFYDGVCFDSDKNGVGIGNGQLNLKTNDGMNVYYGQSYFGDGTYYKFDTSHTKLNIITPNGDIYAYMQCNPPIGINTSSLIKCKTQTARKTVESFFPENSIIRQSSVSSQMNQSMQNTYENSSPTTKSRGPKRCGLCNGRGWIPETKGIAAFGLPDKWCQECDRMVPANHYHTTCPSCKGKGYW